MRATSLGWSESGVPGIGSKYPTRSLLTDSMKHLRVPFTANHDAAAWNKCAYSGVLAPKVTAEWTTIGTHRCSFGTGRTAITTHDWAGGGINAPLVGNSVYTPSLLIKIALCIQVSAAPICLPFYGRPLPVLLCVFSCSTTSLTT